MEVFAQFFGPLGSWLWHASVRASVTVVLVLVAQTLLRRQLSPRWRHALWLLVLVRLVLPWSVESELSVFNWLGGGTARPGPVRVAAAQSAEGVTGPAEPALTSRTMALVGSQLNVGWALAGLWFTGLVSVSGYLLIGFWGLGRAIRQQRPVTDGTVLALLEDCKQEMRVSTPLLLVETSRVNCPALFGFIRPRLLLPPGLLGRFSTSELRYVFLHELAHVKRGDIILNWLSVAPLALHWFNPLAWLAVSRMRADGELACDALALSHTTGSENKRYGDTIIKLLESFSRPMAVPALAGILESKKQMKTRIQMIASFRNHSRLPVVGTVVFASLGLLTLTDACRTAPKSSHSEFSAVGTEPPRIVATVPKVAATDVDPGLTELSVTFDRDMEEGFSWTGAGPELPQGRDNHPAQWKNKRTCVLPVALEGSKYYRVGINSKSYQNFRSWDGIPAMPAALYFTTRGAGDELKSKLVKPEIISMTPKNGATDVDPATSELRIAFNVEMGGGFSWCGGGPDYPTIPEEKMGFWLEGNRTCVLPVQLQRGTTYHLSINCPSANNFQSAGGVPLEPIEYTFKTKD
jgi:bla regulator protein blaR1